VLWEIQNWNGKLLTDPDKLHWPKIGVIFTKNRERFETLLDGGYSHMEWLRSRPG